ncbi:hypothetical protein [Sulfitobacter sp.]
MKAAIRRVTAGLQAAVRCDGEDHVMRLGRLEIRIADLRADRS